MRTQEIVRDLVRLSDKLDNMGYEFDAYRGYRLAGVLCLEYDKKLSNENALMYAVWLESIKSLIDIPKYERKNTD